MSETQTAGAVTEIGPVDYLIVAFPGNQFRGEIAPAIADLVEAGTIRVIDIAFVGKSSEGDVVSFELSDLDPDVRTGLENAGLATEGGLLNEEDLMSVAEGLEPNSSAALLVWENLWAARVAQAMRNAGGILVDFQRIPHEVVQAAREWALETAGMRAEMPFVRRGPGLMRAAATTAVVAGTAGAVRHRQDEKYAAQDQAAYDQQVAAQQAAAQQAAPAAPAYPDYAAELEKLAELKAQGILTEEEFQAKKAQVLGI